MVLRAGQKGDPPGSPHTAFLPPHPHPLGRHLKLNTIPESLAFANRWGDLLVGVERHLYLIHHTKYLPNYYRMKVRGRGG